MSEYLKKIEEFWNEDVRTVVEIQLRRDGETIEDFFPCAEAEHNWYDGTVEGMLALAKRQKLSYTMALKNGDGKVRYVTFGNYIMSIIEKWKSRQKAR